MQTSERRTFGFAVLVSGVCGVIRGQNGQSAQSEPQQVGSAAGRQRGAGASPRESSRSSAWGSWVSSDGFIA